MINIICNVIVFTILTFMLIVALHFNETFFGWHYKYDIIHNILKRIVILLYVSVLIVWYLN